MKKRMVTMGLVVLALFLVLLGGCKKGGSSYSTPTGPTTKPPTTTAPNVVAIAGFAFGPSPLTVTKGTTVTWQNKDNVAHTATADDGSWDTGSISPGASKSLTFVNAGSFAYHCTVHPMMTATLVVQ